MGLKAIGVEVAAMNASLDLVGLFQHPSHAHCSLHQFVRAWSAASLSCTTWHFIPVLGTPARLPRNIAGNLNLPECEFLNTVI
jgi:hypothetical protein